jgi:dihydrofolate reductase
MNIARFEIVVTVDSNWGISYNGRPPVGSEPINSWNQYRKDLTVGQGKNCVIFGSKTFLTLCEGKRTEKRNTYVISSKLKQDDYIDVAIYRTLLDCLIAIGNNLQKFDKVFIMGGYTLFKSAVENFLYLCDKIHVAQLTNEIYDCGEYHFPIDEITKRGISATVELKTRDYTRSTYKVKIVHQEEAYLLLLDRLIESNYKNIVNNGDIRYEINALFNENLSFDIEKELPILTTREIDYKDILGDVVDHIKSREFCKESVGLPLRSFGSIFRGPGKYEDGIDQLSECVENLSDNKSYVIKFLDIQSLPEFVYVYPSSCKRYMNISLSFSNVEVFENLPYFLIYFSLLSKVIAFFSKKIAKYLYVHSTQYSLEGKYLEGAKKITRRTPRPFCKYELKNISRLRTFEDLERGNFDISGYTSWFRIVIKT